MKANSAGVFSKNNQHKPKTEKQYHKKMICLNLINKKFIKNNATKFSFVEIDGLVTLFSLELSIDSSPSFSLPLCLLLYINPFLLFIKHLIPILSSARFHLTF